jgi:malonate decarboxylase epsilon subunit
MGVVTGLFEKSLKEIAACIHTDDTPVYVTNENAPDQRTLSGSIAGIQKVLVLAKERGATKAELLPVTVPSHSPLFSHISDILHQELSTISVNTPTFPYMSNRTARRLFKKEAILEDLVLSISHPVKWHNLTTVLNELGVTTYIEMPPGTILCDLVTKAFPNARALAVEASGLQSAVRLSVKDYFL